MRRNTMLHRLGCALVAAATFAVLPAMAEEKKPNVVFILADNVGYGDLGPYGGGELRGAPTPRIDQLAREGLRLTQYLVEPGCTPSRAALMTGQYSIRNGLSLIIVPGSPSTLSKGAFTMGELFKGAGYATAIFGKWHLGAEPQSLPTAHGFDEFYGIPPDISWDSATYVDTIVLTHSMNAPLDVLLAKGPQIVEAVAGGPLRTVKPYTREVRAEIDTELVAKSIDFMKRQKAAGKPFFLYLPFSMGHFPNLPSKQFAGKSRIGQYGDKLMEGDYHVGQILDTLKELGVDDNTLVVFASDNGPQGETAREMGNQGTPDMGNSGPFRGELGEATEGSIRTFCFVRWPGKVKPGTSSYAMFSIMDFMPTFARIIGAKMPTDRPIDGVDQTDVLFGKSDDRQPRQPADFHRRRSGGSAVEAMAHVLHRRASHRHRASAPARHVLGQRAHGRISKDLQHRNGSARGSSGRRALRMERRAPAGGGSEIPGVGQEVSEPSRGQPHEVLRPSAGEPPLFALAGRGRSIAFRMCVLRVVPRHCAGRFGIGSERRHGCRQDRTYARPHPARAATRITLSGNSRPLHRLRQLEGTGARTRPTSRTRWT